MSRTPHLVLVDPRALQRAQRSTRLRERLLSAGVGIAIAAASAVPLVLSLGH